MNASEFLSNDHQHCDQLWATVEDSSEATKSQFHSAFDDFSAAMQRHFEFEEQHLFPLLDGVLGPSGLGPLAVMRSEHEQMRGVLRRMAAASHSDERQGLLEQGDTLLMLIQQHNLKEEAIVYPAADARLGDGWPRLQSLWASV